MVAHVLKPPDETSSHLRAVTRIEVGRAQVVVVHVVSEDVVDGRQPGGGHGADRLFGAATRSDSVELRAQVAVFAADRCPGALDEQRL